MKVVDDVGLPEPILRAIQNDPYSRGESDISVTGLIKPPLMRALEDYHADEIEEKASGRIYALLGKAVHAILEMAQLDDESRYIRERRFYTDEGGMRVSGQVDLVDLQTSTLHDFKVCSRWVGTMGVKEEWEPQLNIYRLLMHREGVDVDHLKIHAIYRDWSLRESQTKSDYPPTQIQTFNLPVWSLEKAEAWLADKVAKHQAMGKRVAAAKSQDDLLSGICTPEERWDRGNSYAVKHKGKGRAIRVLSTYDAAKLWRDKNRRPGEQLIIEERLGSPTRCLNYCNVKEWCPFGSRLNDE